MYIFKKNVFPRKLWIFFYTKTKQICLYWSETVSSFSAKGPHYIRMTVSAE